MAPTQVRTASGLELMGAIDYRRGDQKLPSVGVGLVAQLGKHNAALCLALRQAKGLPAASQMSGDIGDARSLPWVEWFPTCPGDGLHAPEKETCLIYDNAGRA